MILIIYHGSLCTKKLSNFNYHLLFYNSTINQIIKNMCTDFSFLENYLPNIIFVHVVYFHIKFVLWGIGPHHRCPMVFFFFFSYSKTFELLRDKMMGMGWQTMPNNILEREWIVVEITYRVEWFRLFFFEFDFLFRFLMTHVLFYLSFICKDYIFVFSENNWIEDQIQKVKFFRFLFLFLFFIIVMYLYKIQTFMS